MQRNRIAFLVISVAGAVPVLADTIHVAPCGDDAWTGASAVCAAPNGPKRTIQSAIDVSVGGDTVLVADDTYTGPGNRDMDFRGRTITVRSVSGNPELCVIDVQGGPLDPHRAFDFHSGEGETSVLEGFTMRNGYSPDEFTGSAVRCYYSGPLIRACNFDHNSGARGAAVYAEFTPCTLIGCAFSENTAGVNGGAIYTWYSDLYCTGCTFSHNTATFGGGQVFNWGTAIHTFTTCTFSGNSTTDSGGNGGGALNVGAEDEVPAGTETLTDCRFVGNSSRRLGGALWFRTVQATVTGCTFDNNAAIGTSAGGGGVAVSRNSLVTLTNCLFTRNHTGEARPGAALWVGDGLGGPSNATVVNCTFSQNGATPGGAGLFVTQTSSASVTNCILWGNTPAQIGHEAGATVTLSFSDSQGGWTGSGSDNIDQDPRFADPAAGDFRLAPLSRCIDAGDSSAVPPGILTDLAGLPRFADDPWMPDRTVPPVDMGAHEFQGSSCPVDFNADARVNIQDFLAFLAAYAAAEPRADFNHDGPINIQDFLAFLAAFAAGCA